MLTSQQSKGTPAQARSPANDVKNLLSPSMAKQPSQKGATSERGVNFDDPAVNLDEPKGKFDSVSDTVCWRHKICLLTMF